MSKNLKPGDWVRSYSSGIYRIEKIADTYYEHEYELTGTKRVGDAHDDRSIISKRFLNSKFKKAIGYESCSETFVSPLAEDDLAIVLDIIATKPPLFAEFEAYVVPPILCLYNSELQIDVPDDLERVRQLLEFIRTGKTHKEIKAEMKRLDMLRLLPEYSGSSFGNYAFQLTNYDSEYRDKQMVWRDATVKEK
jgi:hypothetical protein